MDFAEPCPLVRPGLPLFGFCSSGRSFASALLSDGASRRPPLRLASPLSHRTWAEDLHLPAIKHARHTRPVDAQNAPTRLGKLHKPSVFHSVHTDLFFLQKKEDNEERCKCANLIVSTEGFTPVVCAQTVYRKRVARRRYKALHWLHLASKATV